MCTEPPEILSNKHWLVNEQRNVVQDALVGLVRSNPHLALLDIGNVVVRRDHLTIEKVKIVSGGTSGHEPTYSGFVGRGMLTASVQGGVFAPPTPNLVLRTIRELARRHENGILLIVQNNITNRLTFGLAMERAQNIPNVRIRMVKVDDYVQTTEKRGLTGTILIQKIAGAMSERDFFLHEIQLYCDDLVKNNIATSLVALKPAQSPVYEISSCTRPIFPKEMEFGAGLHGQKGYLKIALMSCHNTVQLLLIHMISKQKFAGTICLDTTIPVVIFINNLGNASKIEELIFVNEVVTQLQAQCIIIERVYCNSYMTSLDMCGFSLTILKLTNPEIITYLLDPCEAPFWKSFTGLVLNPETSITLDTTLEPHEIQVKPKRGPRIGEAIAIAIENAINFACGALISCEKQLNIMDSETGDADTGTNLVVPANNIVEHISRHRFDSQWPFMLFQEISKILENSSYGLQTCMYAIMWEAAARPFLNLTEDDLVPPELWLKTFENACQACQCYGKTTFGNGTMYDPLYASLEVLKRNLPIAESDICAINFLDIIGLATVAAEEAAQKTRLVNKHYPDPGAHAVGIWMRAMYEALKLHAHVFIGSSKRNARTVGFLNS